MPEVAPSTRAIVVERYLAHAPEKIWRALTEGTLLERWLMPGDFKPVSGPPASPSAQTPCRTGTGDRRRSFGGRTVQAFGIQLAQFGSMPLMASKLS